MATHLGPEAGSGAASELARINQRLQEELAERRRAEDALRESEERFRQLAENIREFVWLSDPGGDRVLFANPAYEQVWGRSVESIYAQARSWQEAVHPDDRPQLRANLEANRRGFATDVEYRIVRPDGAVRWIRSRAFPVRNGAGEIYRFAGIAEDITERKLADSTLRASEERYRLLAENANDMIARLRPDAVILYMSPACRRLLGYQPDEVQGRSVFDFLHPEDTDAARGFQNAVLQTPAVSPFEHRLRRKDGTYAWFESSARAVRDPQTGQVLEVIAVSRDITDRRGIEEAAREHHEQLAHVARVSMLGEMASGLAHELAQPLTAILYYAKSCVSRLEAGAWGSAEAMQTLDKIAGQAQRAGEFVRGLKAFVRRSAPQRALADINAIVREAAGFAMPLAQQQYVAVRFELADNLPPVVADRIQIEQVILNLVRNGVEAMSGTPLDERVLVIRTAYGPQRSVRVSVQDAGRGLTAEARERLFDPFFSTKPNGLGLGLSISRSVIAAHQGELYAEPDVGRGAAFTFVLPGVGEADHETS